MRQFSWIIGASYFTVKFGCEYGIQWEAPEESRDLIASCYGTTHSALRASPEPDKTLTVGTNIVTLMRGHSYFELMDFKSLLQRLSILT